MNNYGLNSYFELYKTKFMMKNIKKIFIYCVLAVFSGMAVSCTDGPSSPDSKKKGSTLLIYAVATNSLSGNLVSDKNEMLMAAPQLDLDNCNVLLFETQYKYLEDNTRVGNVNLLKLTKDKNSGDYIWENVKNYNDGVAPLDASRMKEVIDYVVTSYPSDKYGLVLWSHSTGSQPYTWEATRSGDTSSVNDNNVSVSLPSVSWFGQDLTVTEGETRSMNIDVLADILPDNLFDYIWFDSCYMSNIESIYQLRNKCNTYVGYPTEVLDSGLPYHYVLPYMVGDKMDLVEAAKTFYNYYANSFGTVAVIDMTKIDDLASYCSDFFSPEVEINEYSLVKFSRASTGPFYDFGDYVKAMGSVNVTFDEEEWLNELDKCVVYKATTSGSLLRLQINRETFSGISTHLYRFDENILESENYYKSLDWFQAVF